MAGRLERPPSIAVQMGYPWEQRKGQRHFGPMPGWITNPPSDTEVFIGKIPRDSDENELVPLFARAGQIYTMRIMMDFSGFNRGFAFVRYTNKSDALKAVKMFNNYRLRRQNRIGVSLSVDNCRLFIGGLPKTATKEEVFQEFSSIARGIVSVIMYPNIKDVTLNRGFAFLEFDSHQSAAAARRDLIPCPDTRFGKLMVDWAEPEPKIADSVMEQVKVLYVRNLNLRSSEAQLLELFTCVGRPGTVQRVKKINDFAFVHFELRSDAEKALTILNGVRLDGNELEIHWARPVRDKELYKLQKLIHRGSVSQSALYANATNNRDATSLLTSHKSHLNSKPHCAADRVSGHRTRAPVVKTNPFVCSTPLEDCKEAKCVGGSEDTSCIDLAGVPDETGFHNVTILNSKSFIGGFDVEEDPVQVLENMCSYYGWCQPTYELRHTLHGCCYLYHCWVTLCIGRPFYLSDIYVGPFHGTHSHRDDHEAKRDAAKVAIDYIDMMCSVAH